MMQRLSTPEFVVVAALLSQLSICSSGGATLVDHPIAASADPIYLDGNKWSVTSSRSNRALSATVPGDIITDLQRAGIVEDPYWNLTWRESEFIAIWNSGKWTYFRHFQTPQVVIGSDADLLLVLDGIRMGAMIALNGKPLGNATDQFQRYTYVLRAADLRGVGESNELTVTFGAELGIDCGGRYTYSSQIDWAPDMLTKDPLSPKTDSRYPRSTFGFGIWKSIYLLPLLKGEAAISQLVLHTFYAGGHPTELLSDGNHKGFKIKAQVELFSRSAVSGVVSILGSWPAAQMVSENVSLTPGSNTVILWLGSNQSTDVKLWHPHGHGQQSRYDVTATFSSSPASGRKPASTSRKIGFRHVALVTVDDTKPDAAASAAQSNGTGQLTMFFRVNGAVLYARGANKIPMDLLDGRMTATAHRRLVQSAAEGNFNMLRVWGGGIWEPRAFFDAADEFGILLYMDLQFTWESLTGSVQERAEVEYQLKRLSHHPSVALWDGCNECGGTGLYQEFAMPTVASIDKSRPIWPSCPATGWTSGVDTLSSRPNGAKLVTGFGSASGDRYPGVPYPQEAHGPYSGFLCGPMPDAVMPTSWPVRNSTDKGACLNRPTAVPALMGVSETGWFRSEFGCVAWSSFESMAGTMPSDQWSMSSAAAQKRNWNASNLIANFFGQEAAAAMSEFGEVAFKRQLYQSLIAQVLFLKTEIEAWRSQNVWGTLFWMYNEIWPTSGWGSIEYGAAAVPGQVEGGRWKPLHYILKSNTFADQLSTCNTAGACFARNDSPFLFNGAISIRLLNVMSGASSFIEQRQSLQLERGAGSIKWFCAAEQILSATSERSSYRVQHCQQPNANFTDQDYSANEIGCEAICNNRTDCIGFTMKSDWLIGCSFYKSVPGLHSNGDFEWHQKPEIAPIPSAPPLCKPPPPQLGCRAWADMPAWEEVACEANGSNCLLLINVTNSSGGPASYNVLPFVAPKYMKLPRAEVSVVVGDVQGNHVTISVSGTATALFVVLTTKAEGRFSDNAFLLEAGEQRVISFVSWGTLDTKEIALLKASLRVEHLAENLGTRDESFTVGPDSSTMYV